MIAGSTVLKNRPDAPAASGKVQEVGTVYCGVAGMLNLLLIVDLMMRAAGSASVEETAKKTD